VSPSEAARPSRLGGSSSECLQRTEQALHRLRAMPARRCEQRGIIQFRELPGQRKAAVDAPLEESPVDGRIAFLPSDHELIEMTTVAESSFKSADLVDRAREFPSATNVLRRDPTEAIRTKDRHVRGRPDCKERFVRADIRHRLLAADVLFAGLEGHAERAMTLRVSRHAD